MSRERFSTKKYFGSEVIVHNTRIQILGRNKSPKGEKKAPKIKNENAYENLEFLLSKTLFKRT